MKTALFTIIRNPLPPKYRTNELFLGDMNNEIHIDKYWIRLTGNVIFYFKLGTEFCPLKQYNAKTWKMGF